MSKEKYLAKSSLVLIKSPPSFIPNKLGIKWMFLNLIGRISENHTASIILSDKIICSLCKKENEVMIPDLTVSIQHSPRIPNHEN